MEIWFSIVGKKKLNLLTKNKSYITPFQFQNCKSFWLFQIHSFCYVSRQRMHSNVPRKSKTTYNLKWREYLLTANCSLFSSFFFIIFTLRQILFCRNMLLTVADLKFQSGVDPHAFGNVLMPVMYQQMFQV